MQGIDHRLLLRGGDPAEHRRGRKNLAECHGIGGERSGIDRLIGPGHAGLTRDGADRGGVVAGDHLHAHALLEEVADGLGGIGPQPLIDDNEGDGREDPYPGVDTRRLGAGADHEHPSAISRAFIAS